MKRYLFSLIVIGLVAHGIGSVGASTVTKYNTGVDAKIEQATK